MGGSDEWKALLEMGGKDLRALVLFESSVELADEIFGFHAQQAAEKVLTNSDKQTCSMCSRSANSKKTVGGDPE